MEELGKIFAQVSRFHGSLVHNEVSKLGVGRGMPPVLSYIRENDGCKQSEINKMGHVSPATVTVMLQSLEKNGLIKRWPDPDDQRCIRIYITPRGSEIAELGKKAIEAADREFFSCLTEKESKDLLLILKKLGEQIKNKYERNNME